MIELRLMELFFQIVDLERLLRSDCLLEDSFDRLERFLSYRLPNLYINTLSEVQNLVLRKLLRRLSGIANSWQT